MKRVLCPKCENYLYFDETKYSEGQSLVFECEHCGKQFSIRLGKSKVKALRKEENLEEEAESHKEEFGYIEDGAIVTIGATTFILQTAEQE